MASVIRVVKDGPLPLEQQIHQELRHAIARSEVAAGEGLPSVRQLAGDLGVHWNTVARAYRRLADEGLVAVRRGRGVVVQTPPAPRARATASARESVQDKLRQALTEAHLAGVPLESVRAWFREEAAALFPRKDRT
jgi:DNA-binding transcriptional regulator YhcF (GntR family)